MELRDHRVALCIGNGAYGGSNSLPNCVADAEDMGACSRAMGFDDVTVLRDKTKSQIYQQIRRLRGSVIQSGSIVLFYFSGHGAEHEGVTYLLPDDVAAWRLEAWEERADLGVVIPGTVAEFIWSVPRRIDLIPLRLLWWSLAFSFTFALSFALTFLVLTLAIAIGFLILDLLLLLLLLLLDFPAASTALGSGLVRVLCEDLTASEVAGRFAQNQRSLRTCYQIVDVRLVHEKLASMIPYRLNDVLWEAVEVFGAANPIGVTLLGVECLLLSPFSLPAYQVVPLAVGRCNPCVPP
eukprot:SAG11_NODE_1200_length_5538_cov_8.582460_3_plen_295_part_00